MRASRIPLFIGDPSEGMEHLWSQAGATGGNRSQMGHPQKRLKQADRQPVATHGNGSGAHGKEGVNGSSPLEGSDEKPLSQRLLSFWRMREWQRTGRHGTVSEPTEAREAVP
jgi:hypothetical protein